MSLVERCRQRHLGNEGEDEGFTLIELLVVLLIIGILLAIAIPTFLSVTKGANNTASQSNLQNALTGAKTYYTDSNQTYTGLLTLTTTTSDIQQIGTGLVYTSSGSVSSGAHVVNVAIAPSTDTAGAGSYLVLAAFSPGSNDCWLIADITTNQVAAVDGFPAADQIAGTYYGVTHASSATTCSAYIAPTNTSTSGFPSP